MVLKVGVEVRIQESRLSKGSIWGENYLERLRKVVGVDMKVSDSLPQADRAGAKGGSPFILLYPPNQTLITVRFKLFCVILTSG